MKNHSLLLLLFLVPSLLSNQNAIPKKTPKTWRAAITTKKKTRVVHCMHFARFRCVSCWRENISFPNILNRREQRIYDRIYLRLIFFAAHQLNGTSFLFSLPLIYSWNFSEFFYQPANEVYADDKMNNGLCVSCIVCTYRTKVLHFSTM